MQLLGESLALLHDLDLLEASQKTSLEVLHAETRKDFHLDRPIAIAVLLVRLLDGL